jgi:hypothetical protein
MDLIALQLAEELVLIMVVFFIGNMNIGGSKINLYGYILILTAFDINCKNS